MERLGHRVRVALNPLGAALKQRGDLVGVLFHLGIETSMHLFLFQWLMILGLLTFYPQRKANCSHSSLDLNSKV